MIRNFTTIFAIFLSISLIARESPYGFLLSQDQLSAMGSTNLPAQNTEALKANAERIEEMGGRTNHGVILFTEDLSFENAGTWEYLDNGDRVWFLRVQSPGAVGISVFFKKLHLPEGTSLFFYPINQSSFEGPVTVKDCAAHGAFGTAEAYGDDMILEYYEPAGALSTPSIDLYGVGHYYRFVYDYNDNRGGPSEACEVDVNCPEGAEWTAERDAVVRLQLVDGADVFLCSGAMINTTAMDCRRYLLTAMHCTEGISDADLLLCSVRFNYERSGCGTGSSVTHNRSGVIRHADSNDGGGNSGSDFCLLEVEDAIPSSWNPFFAGWDATGNTPDSGVSIHHPAGDLKKISTTEDIVSGTWGAPGFHWRLEWMQTETNWGVTEGGSSGSPLYDQNHRIVGQLTGGGSFCDAPTQNDYYGKMSKNWNANPNPNNEKLKNWLDPINQGATNTLTMFGAYQNSSLSLPCSVSAEVTENNLTLEDVRVFPTVASESIRINASRFREVTEVRIFNASGILVKVTTLKDVNTTIDVQDLAAGMYYISFKQTNDAILTQKFSVAR